MASTDYLGYMYSAAMAVGGMIHLEETRVTEQRQQKIKMQMGTQQQKSIKATVKAFQVHIKPPMGIFLGALAMGGAYHASNNPGNPTVGAGMSGLLVLEMCGRIIKANQFLPHGIFMVMSVGMLGRYSSTLLFSNYLKNDP